MEKTHWHYMIIAYKDKGEGGALNEAVEVTILDAKSEKDAMRCAKKQIVRPFYFLRKAFQCVGCIPKSEMINLLSKLKKHL